MHLAARAQPASASLQTVARASEPGKHGDSNRTKPPSVRMGATSVSGRLPPEVVQRIARQSFGRFRLCYENGLRTPQAEQRLLARGIAVAGVPGFSAGQSPALFLTKTGPELHTVTVGPGREGLRGAACTAGDKERTLHVRGDHCQQLMDALLDGAAPHGSQSVERRVELGIAEACARQARGRGTAEPRTSTPAASVRAGSADALEDGSGAEAGGAADGDHGITLAASFELVDGVEEEDGAGCAVGVAEGDGAAARVEAVMAEVERAHEAHAEGRKGLGELEDRDGAGGDASSGERELDRLLARRRAW